MKVIRDILSVFFRELKLIGEDHSLLLTLLIAPVLYLFFYGSIYSFKEEEKVKLAVVDDDQSSLSRMLTQQINNLQMVDVLLEPSVDKAQHLMYEGVCQGYLYIDKGLEQKVLTLQQGNVVLAVNAGRFLPSSDLIASVTKICLAVSAGVRMQYFEMKGLPEKTSLKEAMPVNLDYRPMFNDRSSYGAFLLPGLLMLILQQTLLLGLAGSVASERMKKNLVNWFSVTNDHIFHGIIGKGLFYFFLFACYALFALTINFSVFHLTLKGNAGTLMFLITLFLLSLIPMAMLIGSFFKSQLLCLQIMAFSSYPFFLITGYSWPFRMLPIFIQVISSLLPTTPFMQAYISVTQQGGTLSDNSATVIHLLGLVLLFSCLCYWRLKYLVIRSREYSILEHKFPVH
ncbi:MAG: ABC transporter permease [Bacteroidales bacterium]|jgi:ABC-2 type transport system permease protein|nr:ABC transporter permease [Bacteroidales bacterium]